MGFPEGLEVDHINRDTLDNRKVNLRAVTRRQNSLNRGKLRNNTSGHTGVSWDRTHQRWVVQFSGKKYGTFISLHDAVARQKAVVAGDPDA